LLCRPALALGCQGAALLTLLFYPRLGPKRWRRRRAATLHLRPLGSAGRALGFGLPFLLPGILLLQLVYARYWGWLPRQLTYAYEADPLGGVVVLSTAILIGPVIEEFAFRGFLQGGASRSVGPWIGGALGAAFFAAAHMSAGWMPYFFLNGAIFAYLFVRTGTIWSCVIAHASVNAWVSALSPAHHWIVARAAAVPSAVLWICSALLLSSALYLSTPRVRPGRRLARGRAGLRFPLDDTEKVGRVAVEGS
ncbi:MAG TPA: CPBP family intramembrane glutamic endopeptidase, partial [Longimicrobiales bacterium]